MSEKYMVWVELPGGSVAIPLTSEDDADIMFEAFDDAGLAAELRRDGTMIRSNI